MISEILNSVSFLQPQHEDDFVDDLSLAAAVIKRAFSVAFISQRDARVDRFNYYYSSSMVMIFAMAISFKMFGGRPLECWLPPDYTKSWEDYSGSSLWGAP